MVSTPDCDWGQDPGPVPSPRNMGFFGCGVTTSGAIPWIPWYTMNYIVFNGLHCVLWTPMVFHVIHDITWTPWKTMEPQGDHGINGIPQKPYMPSIQRYGKCVIVCKKKIYIYIYIYMCVSLSPHVKCLLPVQCLIFEAESRIGNILASVEPNAYGQ